MSPRLSLQFRRIAVALFSLGTLAGLGYLMALASFRVQVVASDRPRGPTIPSDRAREADWLQSHVQNVGIARRGGVELLFLGDSITAGWLGTARTPQDGDGLAIWNREYSPLRAANFGVGSDRIEHLLWRLQHGELDRIKPRLIVLMIGTNNLGIDEPDEIVDGVAEVIATIRRRTPDSWIVLNGLLPRLDPSRREQAVDREVPDTRIELLNRQLKLLSDRPRVMYLEFGNLLLDDDGLMTRVVQPDYLHLAEPGYQTWAEALRPIIREHFGDPPRLSK